MAKNLSPTGSVWDHRGGTAEAVRGGQAAVQTRYIDVTDIRIGARLRELDEAALDALSASMSDLGLKTPISVRPIPPEPAAESGKSKSVTAWALVAGAHRLAAAKKLGWKTIMCIVGPADDVEAELWEIAENLHRADLTVQQRADHIAAYVRLREKRGRVSSQVEAKPRGGRPEGGLRAAARDLGLDKSEVARAVKIASISEKARSAATATKLTDNQSALLAIASIPSPEAQVAKVEEIASRRDGGRTRNKAAAKSRAGSASEAEPESRSEVSAAPEARAVRETAFDALVELLGRRLGKAAHRFVRLSRDTGSTDLLRLAAAIEQKLSKAGSAAGDRLAPATPQAAGPPTAGNQLILT